LQGTPIDKFWKRTKLEDSYFPVSELIQSYKQGDTDMMTDV
jgi:hypothetical protein